MPCFDTLSTLKQAQHHLLLMCDIDVWFAMCAMSSTNLSSRTLISQSYQLWQKLKIFACDKALTKLQDQMAYLPTFADTVPRRFLHIYMELCSRPFCPLWNLVGTRAAILCPFGSKKDLNIKLNLIVASSWARPMAKYTMHGWGDAFYQPCLHEKHWAS